MPRESAASLSIARVDGRQAPLRAPAGLSEPAREVWERIAAAVPAAHFRASDVPLLKSFCESTALADRAAEALERDGAVIGGRASPWLTVQEKAIRAQAALALRLRLCPSARTDPKTTGREKTAAPNINWSDE